MTRARAARADERRWSIAIAILAVVAGAGAGSLAAQTGGSPSRSGDPNAPTYIEFVRRVLGATEDTWKTIFSRSGRHYKEPKLVLFSASVQTACGFGSAASGPFYCEDDQKLYLDTRFFRALAAMGGSAADFAQAYVIAHEVGHHVQTLLGISAKVRALEGKLPEAERNALSVRVELQADCLAGLWAHVTDKKSAMLEPGDVEAALAAASALGNDVMQRQAQGVVVPDSFTHGTAAQRVRWFRRGLASGELSQCDTFSASPL